MCICIDKTILILQTDEPSVTKASTLITTLNANKRTHI